VDRHRVCSINHVSEQMEDHFSAFDFSAYSVLNFQTAVALNDKRKQLTWKSELFNGCHVGRDHVLAKLLLNAESLLNVGFQNAEDCFVALNRHLKSC
jgi:hypothetical protein